VQPHFLIAFAIAANSSCVRNVDSSVVSVVLWSRYFSTASCSFAFSPPLAMMKAIVVTIKSANAL